MRPKLPPPSGFERKVAFKEAFQANKHIHIKDLVEITDLAQNTIEGYLYEESRYPSMWILQIMYWMINRSNGILPTGIRRIVQRYYLRSLRWGDKNKLPDRPSKTKSRVTRRYQYYGKILTVRQIVKKAKVPHTWLYKVIKRKNRQDGDDITDIIENYAPNLTIRKRLKD